MSINKTLIIVESPSKCKKIEEYLGKELYKCVASFGHIRELNISKGISCIQKNNNYEPIFKIMTRQLKRINELKKDIYKYKEVLLATDDDREGEAIAWHLCEVLKLPIHNTKRIIFHEITKTALKHAVENPTVINMNTVYSQKARQVLDLLVGFSVSPILWKQISSDKKSSLSAGRCQTPALRLVYDNFKEIENTNGVECYDINGLFKVANKEINYKLSSVINSKETSEEFLCDSVNYKHKIKNDKPKDAIRKCPEPFTTSSLQQKASNILHYSPKMTMDVAQKLYESGYITYMRTDSKKYCIEFVNNTKDYITKKYGEEYIRTDFNKITINDGKNDNHDDDINRKETKNTISKSKSKKDKKEEHPHEAIRPTDINRTNIEAGQNNKNKELGPREIKLYRLIWSNTVESCMSEVKLLRYTSNISAPMNKTYINTLEKVIFKGWSIIQNPDNSNTKGDSRSEYDIIKEMVKDNTIVEYSKINANFTMKDLKQHYTEAKLVSLLESKGIGRPSTFSSLITKIQERGYVKVDDIEGVKIKGVDFELIGCEITEINKEKICGNERKKIVLQPIGKIVIEFLIDNYEDIFNYEYTDKMEKELDNIENGKKEWFRLCEECDMILTGINKIVNENCKKTIFNIDDTYTYKIGRYGGYIEKKCSSGKKDIEKLKIMDGITLENIKEMIKNGSRTTQEIIDNIVVVKINPVLGQYKGKDVLLKNGKYGLYVCYDGVNKSLKTINKEHSIISLDDVIPFISSSNSNYNVNKNVIREINNDISIRKGKGKSGNYVFYKTTNMKKPKFISIAKYKGDIENDNIEDIISWVNTKL